jgi:hypothetical protein
MDDKLVCQTVGVALTWHIFLKVGKTQDLPNKIWQILGDARTIYVCSSCCNEQYM